MGDWARDELWDGLPSGMVHGAAGGGQVRPGLVLGRRRGGGGGFDVLHWAGRLNDDEGHVAAVPAAATAAEQEGAGDEC